MFQLSNSEREELGNFKSWEDFKSEKTNISNRINLEKTRKNGEKYASVDQITTGFNNLRFAHQIVFNHKPNVFFDAVNYTFRAIGEKNVELKVFTFLMNTAYVMSVQQVMNHIMTDGELNLLLEMSNFSMSDFGDFERMKICVANRIENDMSTVTILSYLKLIFNFIQEDNQIFLNVIDLAMILSTSCELTKHSYGCQALSLVSWVARHIDIDPTIKDRLSTLPPIPTLFFSPSRITVFRQFLKISQNQINDCCRDMQVFYIKYYTSLCNRKEKKTNNSDANGNKLLAKKLKDMSDIYTNAILEENENESESNSYHIQSNNYHIQSYTFKPNRRMPSASRAGDTRAKSKNRLRAIRKYKSTSR